MKQEEIETLEQNSASIAKAFKDQKESKDLKKFIEIVYPYKDQGFKAVRYEECKANDAIREYCKSRFMYLEEKKDHLIITFKEDKTDYNNYVSFLEQREKFNIGLIGFGMLFGVPMLIMIVKDMLTSLFG